MFIPLALLAALALLAWLADDARGRGLMVNTLWLAAGSALIAVPCGTLLAVALVRTQLHGRTALGLLLVSMIFLPLVVQVGAWQAGFGLQGWFTLRSGGDAWLDGMAGAIWVHGVAAIAWAAIIVAAGLWFVEPELEEDALLDASTPQVLWNVTLRRAVGSVTAAAIWTALIAGGEITVTDVFQVRTYAEELFTQLAAQADVDAAPLAVLPGALLLLLLMVAAVVVCGRLLPAEGLVVARRAKSWQPALRRRWLHLLTWLVIGVVVGVPLVNLLYKAGIVVDRIDGELVRSWSLGKAMDFVVAAPRRYPTELAHSIWIASVAASLATVAALQLAWQSCRGPWRRRGVLLLVAAGLAIPGPLVGLLVISTLNQPQLPALTYLYDQTVAAPLLAQTLRALPIATLVLWFVLRLVPRELLEAAETDGAGGQRQLWSIVVPERAAAVAAAWVIAFAIAFGELPATYLTIPPGIVTLPVQIFNWIHYGVEDYVAGIVLALLGLYLAIGALIIYLQPPHSFTRR